MIMYQLNKCLPDAYINFQMDVLFVVLFLGGECLFLFAHEMNKSLLLETWINWMIRFGKVNCSVLSGPTAVRDVVGLR
jgi:hypothetical protein